MYGFSYGDARKSYSALLKCSRCKTMLRSVQLLCRSEDALLAASLSLRRALGAASTAQPRKLATATGGVIVCDVLIPATKAAGQATTTVAIQLLHTPEQRWHWREPRESDSPLELVRCVGASVGPAEGTVAEGSHLEALLRRLKGWEDVELESPASRTGSAGSCGSDGSCNGSGSCKTSPPPPAESGPFWSRMVDSVSASVAARWESAREARRGRRIGGAHLLTSDLMCYSSASGAANDSSAFVSAGAADVPLTLKELVLGAEDMGIFHASQAALEAAGARRHPAAPAVWRLPVDAAGPAHRGMSATPAVRLIPSRYSALVFHAPAPLSELEGVLLSRLGAAGDTSGSGEGDALRSPSRPRHQSTAVRAAAQATQAGSVSLYGVRRGDEESGQLALSLPALHPLDIRFCASQRHAAFFNERPETMSDDVDPATNPPADAPSKQVSMACPSVVGMEVRSTIKRRVQEL